MSKKVNETLDMGSVARVINLPAPATANEPARKTDLDAVQTSLRFMETPVVAVATANVNVASPGATFDGVAPTSGDLVKGRILLSAQTTPSENGTWIWNGAATPMTRTTDGFVEGTVVFTNNDGTTFKNTLWVQTTANPVPGTSAMTFTQLPFEATSAGTGLTKTGNSIALTIPVAISSGGTGAVSAAAAKTSLGFPTTFEQDFGDAAASSFNITHSLGNKYCAVTVTLKSTGADEDCAVVRTDANTLVLSSEAWVAAPPALNAYHVACRG